MTADYFYNDLGEEFVLRAGPVVCENTACEDV